MSDVTKRISAKAYRELMGLDTPNAVPKPKGKYGAQRSVSRDGKHFGSKLECAVYETLCLEQSQGELIILALQAPVQLTPKHRWKVDFLVFNRKTLEHEWHEAKGVDGDKYLEDRKLWELYGPGKLIVWKGNYKHPSRAPGLTIIPKNMEAK